MYNELYNFVRFTLHIMLFDLLDRLMCINNCRRQLISPMWTRPAQKVFLGTILSLPLRDRRPRRRRRVICVPTTYGQILILVDVLRSGGESVHVNVDYIAEGTLFPFGGHLCTHWEYLAAAAADPASVSTWIRIENPDRDGRPL